MNECGNCNWVGQWETYEDSGYDGYLCDVCAWTYLNRRLRWKDMGQSDLGQSIALIANVICSALHIDFDLAVKTNQLLLEDNE